MRQLAAAFGAATLLVVGVGFSEPRQADDLLSVQVRVANFRAGPSTDREIVFTATRYFPVQVLEQKGSWVRVRDFEKEEAWIARRLLGKTPSLVVDVKKGNVRAAGDLEAEVVDEVIYGEVFRIAKRRGRWLQIATPKKVIGWVRDDLTWGEAMKPPPAANGDNKS